jgi:hypothetical protein
MGADSSLRDLLTWKLEVRTFDRRTLFSCALRAQMIFLNVMINVNVAWKQFHVLYVGSEPNEKLSPPSRGPPPVKFTHTSEIRRKEFNI